MLCLLLLTLLTFSLSKVRTQTKNQEEIHGPRAECVPWNISIEHAVSWPCTIALGSVVLPLPTCPRHKDESLIPSAENRIG